MTKLSANVFIRDIPRMRVQPNTFETEKFYDRPPAAGARHHRGSNALTRECVYRSSIKCTVPRSLADLITRPAA
jgi:hypothetical protein